MANEVDYVMDLDPLDLADKDIDAIIAYERRMMSNYEAGIKPTKEGAISGGGALSEDGLDAQARTPEEEILMVNPEFMRAMEAVGIETVVIDENTEFPTYSPFLPDTNIQFAWDATSIDLLKRCPRLYQYKMIDGWTDAGDNIHLRFGQEFHQAFADFEHFKLEADDYDDALRLTIRALLGRIFEWDPTPTTKSEGFKTKRGLIRSVIWYLDKYKDDPAETVIMEDGKPGVEVSFRFELDWGPQVTTTKSGESDQPYILCGHLDRIVNYQDDIYVMDHKTASSTITPYYFNQFSPNTQMSLYTLASQVVLSAPVKGIMLNAIQIATDYVKPVRGMTYRTKGQLDEWLYDLKYWLVKAEEYAVDGYWPMNDTACDKYGGCKFREICSKDPGARERFLKSNFVKGEPWNPLRAR